MESLLSVAFDNLSSSAPPKIRKGLRQVEGLLAQICLSTPKKSSLTHRRASSIATSTVVPEDARPPELGTLKDDAAFREFFKLQEGFQWNVTLRLITCLDRLLGKGSNGQNDLLLLSCLSLTQGVLLLHPPSRTLFARESSMNLLLDLLDPVANPPAIQSATLITLVCALLDQPRTTRVFEALDGLLTVTSLFRGRTANGRTTREVKVGVVEFLYFYLMPETPPTLTTKSAPGTENHLQRTPSQLTKAFSTTRTRRGGSSVDDSGDAEHEQEHARSTEEKQKLLGKYLSNVDDLVRDLRESAPFGGEVC
ncbi:MAG: hypothetical protein M1817_004082 [Caeruleum heppii]|nr:MAG: hypothetical protein M1817_004082 [Caeruleum heppii]